MTRKDLACIHEPFGDAFYYGFVMFTMPNLSLILVDQKELVAVMKITKLPGKPVAFLKRPTRMSSNE